MFLHQLFFALFYLMLACAVLAKTTESDKEFLARLSKITLSDIKIAPNYNYNEVGGVQRYNGSVISPLNGYKLAIYPPFTLTLIRIQTSGGKKTSRKGRI
ncbi:unnamed protein product [Ceratitis capitata]|uniref:(Mediterranean fruit fly) hypothetical protein n=1 Tax=Ceratitis capitata TaxID=7213 RepID=A0A811VIU2_CERCA|nr:unnamed protein product [Ceratitis capitata]